MNTTNATDKTIEALLKIDLSPIDLSLLSKKIARAVNVRMGIKDGGNISIATGKVMYPEDEAEKRQRVLTAIIEK